MKTVRHWPVSLPALFAACALLVWGAVAGTRYWSIYRDTTMARTQMHEAESILRDAAFEAGTAELDAADRRLADAEGLLIRAWRRLQTDPLAGLARRLPAASDQVRALDGLLALGIDGAAAGRLGVAAAREYDAVRATADAPLSEKVVAVLDGTRAPMEGASARLDTAGARREALRGLTLLPPLAAALADAGDGLDEAGEAVAAYEDVAAFLPEFLGFRGPRTYLVLAQNNAELLPTGGLISVVGVLRLDGGRIEESAFQDAVAFGERWLASTGEYVAPPAPLKHYLLKDWSWNLALSNWSPDFPTAASQALDFWYRGGGRAVDGVVALDVAALEALLEVTGPIEVPEYGVTVDSANALDTTEALTRSPLEPGGDRKAFVAALAEELIPRLVHTPGDRWSALVRALERLRDERHLLFYSPDPEIQALARRAGLDAAVRSPQGDYAMVVDASVNSTKLNIALWQSATLDVRLDGLGDAHSRLDIAYRNDVARWAAGRDGELVYRLMLDGMYGGYVRLLAPARARLAEIRVDGRPAGAEEVSLAHGKAVFGRFFSLARDERRAVSFRYVVPAAVEFEESTATYRLTLQKQPGTNAIRWRVSISVPEGARLLSLEVDGKAADLESEGPVQVTTDLGRDRQIVLRYRTPPVEVEP